MRKNVLLIISLAMFLTACGQKAKQNTPEQPQNKQTEAAYDYLNPSQNDGKQKKTEDFSGKVISLTATEFLEQITDIDQARGLRYKGQTPCMVDFYADWCRPCMQLKPITERLAEKYKGKLIIYKVNVDKAQDICQALGISSIPTLFFFKPNAQPGKMVGAPTEAELEKVIQDFLK